ncbi:MAG: hypothetical protein A3E81_01790 [Gammaproteobacteria bacterium RIFCSPHIGHO2_12_FULL_36_30]|nr:MAG: hypothetical protein A3E81_01790 [Gammaproteobacteria bacterium RIFCSPHIGHO2_12_FULL_36_30]
MDFYYFSHFLQIWILPPGLNLLLMGVGLIFLTRTQYLGKSLIAISGISFWLFCTPAVAQLLINYLQEQYPRLQVGQITKKKSSAIIVLGGGHTISTETSSGYILSGSTEFRLRYAVYLYRHTHFPIIVSGGATHKSSPAESHFMKVEMKNYFKTPVAWQENQSINTRDEGNLMVPILEKHNIRIAYLITNAWHMPRAMYTFHYSFRHTDIKIIAAPMGYSTFQRNQGVLNFLPSLGGLDTSELAIHEYIGILAYRLNNLI